MSAIPISVGHPGIDDADFATVHLEIVHQVGLGVLGDGNDPVAALEKELAAVKKAPAKSAAPKRAAPKRAAPKTSAKKS